MGSVTYTQLVEAIRATVATAVGLNEAQAGVTISEAIENAPLVQVYLESETTDVATETDRTTFRAGVRQAEIVCNIDVYVKQRAQIGEDMRDVMVTAQAVRDKLAAQNVKPYFGEDGIQAFRWSMERVTFRYSEVDYAGVRFILTTRIY